jgi:hypothetical protein
MSNTPRTDVAEHNMGSVVEPHYVVDIYFAQQLERELAEAIEELNDKRKFCYAVEQALDGVKGDYVEIIKELRKDAERYRYVRSIWGLPDEKFNDEIDAAMKEGK